MALSTDPFALFEGIGNTTMEMVAGIFENLVVKIIISMLLSRLLGLYSYWLGCAVSTFVSPLVGLVYYFSGLWTKRKVEVAT